LWLFGGYAIFGESRAIPIEMIGLWALTVVMLVMPRVLGVVSIVRAGEEKRYGGTWALARSAVLEGTLSVLQAPVRMVAHSIFVVVALTGLKLDWKSPPREANDIGWRDAGQRFAPVVAIVALLGIVTIAIAPAAALWLLPVGGPLLLAIPMTVLSSRSDLGQRVRQLNLLVTPEESVPPTVLRQADLHARRSASLPRWQDAVNDPWLFDVVRSAMGPRNTTWGSRGLARRRLVRGVLHEQDTERLSASDRMRFLSEPQSFVRLRDQLVAHARAGQSRPPRAVLSA
jgi:membrane glycosyltransferase